MNEMLGSPERIRSLKIFVLTLVAAVLIPAAAFSQGGKEGALLTKARKALAEKNYQKAKKFYNDLLQVNSTSSDYYFETGLTYYNSKREREQSVALFEKALKFSTRDTIGEIYYYLGLSNQYIAEFEKAIVAFNRFKVFLQRNKPGSVLARDVGRYIEMCNSGLAMSNRPRGFANSDMRIQNLGPLVNTTFPEYGPVVRRDESVIIFTSRKSGSTGGKYYHDDKFYEDIYISTKNASGVWSQPSKIDSSRNYIASKINSKKHDAAISYSMDEKKLFIYRKNDIWVSEFKGGKWRDPERMGNNINTKGHEPSAYLSSDESSLYIVSNRSEGFGGRDIFVSKKQKDGTWGVMTSLGPKINTQYDEDAPYVTPDGKYFFFSSNGHNTMGGYDIFKCEIGPDGKFGPPENIGGPVNTPGDDIYYVEIGNDIAYYSSSQDGGYGDMDVYRIYRCENIPKTEIRGVVLAGDNQKPVGATIIVSDPETGKEVGNYQADPRTGKYFMILEPNKEYNMEIDAKDWLPHHEVLKVPKQCEKFQLYQEVHIKYLRDSVTAKITHQQGTFHDAMFDIKTESELLFDIENLADPNYGSKKDPSLTYTDIVGKLSHNDILDAERVKVYLTNEKNQILRMARTNDDGVFRFPDIPKGKNYKVLIDVDDTKISYYGDGTDLDNATTMLQGSVYYDHLPDAKKGITSQPMSDLEVYFVNLQKEIINFTNTDANGAFVLDNVATDLVALEELRSFMHFVYNIDSRDLDVVFSAFIKTLDPNTTLLQYTEYIDLIELPDYLSPDDIIAFENILFDFDRYFLREASKNVLERVAAYMIANPTVMLEMSGHTDWLGNVDYNEKLSKNRTMSAYNYLKGKGIAEGRLRPDWHGESAPAALNTNPNGTDNPYGRQLNRRVEFKIIFPTDVADLTIAFNY